MPAVPGAKGLRPEPKPNAMKCAGWLRRNLTPGRSGAVSAARGTAWFSERTLLSVMPSLWWRVEFSKDSGQGLVAMPVRNPAIVQACATRCYSMKEIAQAFVIQSAAVSRVVKKGVKKVGMQDLTTWLLSWLLSTPSCKPPLTGLRARSWPARCRAPGAWG